MAFTAQQVIILAQTTLQDADAVRWPLAELLRCINAGTREIALQKPTATSATIELALVAGTKQQIPDGYHLFLSASHNVANGKPVRTVERETLDTEIPGWHSPAILPRSATAMFVTDDHDDTSTFYVCPGNDGTGLIVATLSRLPEAIPVPASPTLIASYGATVPLGDIYQNCLLDYVLYRAFSKDINIAGSAARAQAHYGLFQQALGIKAQTEATQNVDRPQSRFSQ